MQGGPSYGLAVARFWGLGALAIALLATCGTALECGGAAERAALTRS